MPAFCDVPKIALYCDTFKPGTEKRDDVEVKILTLSLRIPSVTPELAQAIDPRMRKTLFKGEGADPAPHLSDVRFTIDLTRQLLRIYATYDSGRPSIAFDQVLVGKLRATWDTVWSLDLKAAFGPCSAQELAFCQDWFGTQRFVTFDAAQGELALGTADAPTNDDQADDVDPPPAPRPRGPRRITH
jgi:hypothetical protein